MCLKVLASRIEILFILNIRIYKGKYNIMQLNTGLHFHPHPTGSANEMHVHVTYILCMYILIYFSISPLK